MKFHSWSKLLNSKCRVFCFTYRIGTMQKTKHVPRAYHLTIEPSEYQRFLTKIKDTICLYCIPSNLCPSCKDPNSGPLVYMFFIKVFTFYSFNIHYINNVYFTLPTLFIIIFTVHHTARIRTADHSNTKLHIFACYKCEM